MSQMLSEGVKQYIQRLPKAELHVHIEGTFEPQLMFKIAERNGLSIDRSLEEVIEARKGFADLQEFLNMYYDALSVLKTEEDFYDLAMAYFLKAKENNVRHCEVFFDPQTHIKRGLSFSIVISGLHRAARDVAGISVQYIMCFLRDLPESEALELVEIARPYADKISGVGLDSAEIGNHTSKFENAYKAAVAAGLCGEKGDWVVAHSGEEGGADYVFDTLNSINPTRIDHGVRSLDDMELIDLLRDRRTPLTACPLSNLKLRVLERFFDGKSVVKRLLDNGIVVTINSDDPAYFGGYLNDNYESAAEEFIGLPEPEIKEALKSLARNSFDASFINDSEKDRFKHEINHVLF